MEAAADANSIKVQRLDSYLITVHRRLIIIEAGRISGACGCERANLHRVPFSLACRTALLHMKHLCREPNEWKQTKLLRIPAQVLCVLVEREVWLVWRVDAER